MRSVEERLGDLTRGHRRTSTATPGWAPAKRSMWGSRRVNGRFVGPHDHPAPPDLLELPDRQLGLACKPEQALGVALEQASGLGQGAVPRGAVEQPLAQLILDPPDRLADGRLGPMEPAGGCREAVGRPKPREMPPDPAAA